MKILTASARKILDSIAKPTIEVEVNGNRASVPVGTSRSQYEAPQLSINLMLRRFKKLRKKAKKKKFSNLDDIMEFEKELNSEEYGGNTILAFSLALLKSLSASKGKQVYQFLGKKSNPKPLFKVIEGGRHAEGPDIQEILVLPTARKFSNRVWEASEFFFHLGEVLEKKDPQFMNSRGLEGGWVTNLTDMQALDLVRHEIDSGGFKLDLGVDIAATSFYSDKYQGYEILDSIMSRRDMMDFVRQITRDYDLVYVEDPLEENDYRGFEELTKKTKTMICGDDLFSTNVKRLKPVCNTAIVKPNQIGSLNGTIEFLRILKKMKMNPVISHRSRETEDSVLAHLAVGLGIPHIKIGLTSGERTSKVNELMRILG